MPLISVIIPAYNRYEQVRNAIKSVLEQSFGDYELIVVDDGSTDNTPAIREEFKNSIKYLRQKNMGVSSARNAGIRASSSGHIAFLDSDDLWLKEKLAEQNEFICRFPDIKIHQTEEIWIRNGKRVNPAYKHRKKDGDIFRESLNMCMISPSSVILRRDLFEEYGYFDERLPACEDYDLWLRITSGENTGLIRKNLIIKYGGHSDQLSGIYWGMDRFRIYSIIKLLSNDGIKINGKYRGMALEVLREKCKILHDGALKRGKIDFADKIQRIIRNFNGNSCSSTDYGFLLEK